MRYYTIEIDGYTEATFVDYNEMMATYTEMVRENPGADIVWGVEWD